MKLVVLDLGFGDAGKGLVVDALVRRTGARTVLRWNGGAQAGHNVVTGDGRHHTFAQLGAGSFVPGTRTALGPEVIVHPTALLAELRVFTRHTPAPPLAIHAAAKLVTPWHQALNRLRELSRRHRHGSCGVGIGEVMADAATAQPLRAGDLRGPLADLAHPVRERLARVAATLPATGDDADRERSLFEPWSVAAWVEAARPAARFVVDALDLDGDVIAEGAQGLLLDERFGFPPHVTWSDTTDRGARALLGDDVVRVGVIRAWPTRHGPGPFPTEAPELRGLLVEHNVDNAWQGRVRTGHFDPTLVARAIAGNGGVDRLVVTHVDAAERAPWACADPYDPATERPVVRPGPLLPTIEARLGRAVDLVSRGPTAETLTGWDPTG